MGEGLESYSGGIVSVMERLTYSTREFAEINGVSERTVKRWIAKRAVKSVKIDGSRRILAAAFLRRIGEADHESTRRRAADALAGQLGPRTVIK